ncbi:MAG TPA: VacJ family lipoprotein [Candidatus Margulisiibacteriota bacterium]|nr:VacJ family lipoprotein [Candidatus Margulisiibacteriota bacterium]
MANDVPPMQSYDPWERANRFTYRFNARFDEHVSLPISSAYRRLPSPIRTGVHNFLSNLRELDSIVNYLLQARPAGGLRSLGRFVINSTVGLGGLIDVASRMELANSPTGFGPTLARWGAHQGPYLVIPLLGPSTLRDAIGLLGDFGAYYGTDVAGFYTGDGGLLLGSIYAVDQRSNTAFRYYASASPFEYEHVRFLYVHRRLIEDEALRGRTPREVGAGAALATATGVAATEP